MPSEKYALEIGGPERLELSRNTFQSEITVRLDGDVIGTIANDKELKKGRTFILPDGSSLTIQLVKTVFKTEVRVVKDGQPLLDSDSNPVNRFGAAYISVFLAGGLSIFFGMLEIINHNDSSVVSVGFKWVTVILGAALLYLGYLVKQKSMVALALAVLITVASGIWAFKVGIQSSESAEGAHVGGRKAYVGRRRASLAEWNFALHFVLLVCMIQGFGAIRTLKQIESSEQGNNV